LNHAPGDAINPLRPIETDSNTLDFTSAFGGTADMAGLAAALVPVENDPDRTSALHADD
jgi:hypothetical protein